MLRPRPGVHQQQQSGSNSDTRERQLDTETKTEAGVVEGSGVEIFVVAFGVCGTDDGKVRTSANYCTNIGNTDPDTVADQRLLKCIATSSSGTNDHYFATATASDLPGIFQQIAQNIAFRLIK